MEDKVFEFMEKMYADLKKEIKSVKTNLKKEILKTNLLIEHDVKPQINALLDGYKQLSEGQEEIKGRLENIEKHMVNQDNEITFLKKVK